MSELMTLEEVADALKVSTRTVEREIADEKLKPSRIRGRVLVHAADLAEYVDSLRVA